MRCRCRKSEVMEVGSRKSEVGSRKSEVGSRKSEVGSRNLEVRSPKSEVQSQFSLSTVLKMLCGQSRTRKPEDSGYDIALRRPQTPVEKQ